MPDFRETAFRRLVAVALAVAVWSVVVLVSFLAMRGAQ